MGLSNGVKIVCGSRKQRKSTIQMLNKSGRQLQADAQKRQRMLAAMSFTQREDFLGRNHASASSSAADAGSLDLLDFDGLDNDADDAVIFETLPPGEEGYYHSHGGDEELFDEIVNGAQLKMVDPRQRKSCVQRAVNAWRSQLQSLADAYLQWKACGPPKDVTELCWTLEIHTMTERKEQTFYHPQGSDYVNETLLQHGYVGASPDRPTVAFSISLLEIYRQLHRVCPRLSILAMTKALSHLHGIPHRSHYTEQLSDAYDCYVEIQREVRRRCQDALGRDSSWEMKNVCPPCLYKVKEEPQLRFSMLAAMDGNNSLKLVDSTFRSGTTRDDDRVLDSDRWISPEYVDIFKDEVKKTCSQTSTLTSSAIPTPPAPAVDVEMAVADEDADIAWLNIAENNEMVESLNICVERWKSAGPEARKKMFALFAIAGIFLSVCRHGHVLVICDMIRSGELMKYPIAVVNKLFDQYGPDLVLGYDIMCAFMKTLSNSSLKERMVGLRLHGVVPAFHGHAHNRCCQVHWHPIYMDGVGLEDFEECEHTFSKSNELAAVTRLATPYHRHQQIDEHFRFHDLDKYAASGNFIYQNYRQALEKIRIDGAALAALSVRLETNKTDYERYLKEEQQYLKSLCSEPTDVLFTVEYMEKLTKLQILHSESEAASLEHKKLDYYIIHQGYTQDKIKSIRTRYRTTFLRWQAYNELVCRFEEEHDIETRWTPDMPQYKEAQVTMSERKYRRALDELEQLVVQRLFEMTKLGMNGIGYRLRDKIGRSLKTRSEAIATALKNYNEAASLLNPPREPLTWTSVIQAATIADFDLLRDSRKDIRAMPWAEPSRCEAMNLYFGLKRAHEEIDRLNVELRRLLTFMIDEHIDYYISISRNLIVNPPLASALSDKWQHRDEVNLRIAYKLLKTSQLPGFSGRLSPSEHLLREDYKDPVRQGIPLPQWTIILSADSPTIPVHVAVDDDDVPSRPEVDVESDAMVQLVERLSV